MKTISAKVLDPTHLELSQPISIPPGELIEIAVPEEGEDESLWREAAKRRFLDAYDPGDAIYDRLGVRPSKWSRSAQGPALPVVAAGAAVVGGPRPPGASPSYPARAHWLLRMSFRRLWPVQIRAHSA